MQKIENLDGYKLGNKHSIFVKSDKAKAEIEKLLVELELSGVEFISWPLNEYANHQGFTRVDVYEMEKLWSI